MTEPSNELFNARLEAERRVVADQRRQHDEQARRESHQKAALALAQSKRMSDLADRAVQLWTALQPTRGPMPGCRS